MFTQTLEWNPKVTSTFKTNTVYTAKLTLTPVSKDRTFNGVSLKDIKRLPEKKDYTSISSKTVNHSKVITIVFPKTQSKEVNPELWFSDDFTGAALDPLKWEPAPNWERQGRSSWQDEEIKVENGTLILSFHKDSSLAGDVDKETADNWISAGAVRTRPKDNSSPLYENGYGYYEARIKFPKINGMWGAFWLMSTNQILNPDNGAFATEIDIVETIANHIRGFNGALNWNGYADGKGNWGSNDITPSKTGVDIYDGEFHVFALDWSPKAYIWYVDGVEFCRYTNTSNINRNPNYIKLSIESAAWSLPLGADRGEMVVDYIKVYSQPPKNAGLMLNANLENIGIK